MRKLTTVEMRDHFSDAVNYAAYQHERVIITKHGKDVAALVSMEDVDLLEALEQILDVERARKALAQGEYVSLEDVKKSLGIL